jgi:hypothetical protein
MLTGLFALALEVKKPTAEITLIDKNNAMVLSLMRWSFPRVTEISAFRDGASACSVN